MAGQPVLKKLLFKKKRLALFEMAALPS